MNSPMSQARSRFAYVPAAAIAVAAAIALFFTGKIFNDADTYWHLATGEWILRHGRVPTSDPFSWSYFGHPWTAHEWISEVLLTCAYRAAGWNGVAVLVGLSFAAAVGALGIYLRRWVTNRAMLCMLGLAILGASSSLLARPHMLALPLLIGWTINLLLAREQNRAPPLWTALLMALWVNLHGSFAIGLALIAPFALEALIASWRRPWGVVRSWGLFGLAAAMAALLNPQGLEGVLYPFTVVKMSSLPVITEWRSADFSHFSVFEGVLLAGLFFAFSIGVRLPTLRLILLLGLLHLALTHARHQFVFVFTAALLFAEPVGLALRQRGLRSSEAGDPLETRAGAFAVAAVLVMAVALRLTLPLQRYDDEMSPISAVAAVPADLRSQPVFNDHDLGGYLIFSGVRTFIDGRTDMYGDDFVQNYLKIMAAPPSALQSRLSALGVRWAILKAGNPAVARLQESSNWLRLYGDEHAVVFVRAADGPLAAGAPRSGVGNVRSGASSAGADTAPATRAAAG